MSPMRKARTIAERYDRNLRYARGKKLGPEVPQPKPTRFWPPENIALLERYQAWRIEGGASRYTTDVIYVPMAGHALGLALKPHTELDLESDLQPAYDYILAREFGVAWNKVCRNALDNFRKFLRQERGLPEPPERRPYLVTQSTEGLPDWLLREIKNYQIIHQRNWRQARLEENLRRFWSIHLGFWRFAVEKCGVSEFPDLKRQHVFDYIEYRLGLGRSASTVNMEVRSLCGFLLFLQEQGYSVPQALTRIPGVKQPQRLPRFLTDEQIARLRDDFETRVREADTTFKHRNAQLDRAAFYLLWQGALRLGELEELRLEDLDIPGRKLFVRNGKGLKDRTVYLSESVIRTLLEYLDVRGPADSDHVFIYRNRALRKDLVRARIKAAGKRAGMKVYPHRLRHTCATQLLNAGCKVTSIQQLLGHKRLNSTMIYARVHDRTVAEDYFEAMSVVEGSIGKLA